MFTLAKVQFGYLDCVFFGSTLSLSGIDIIFVFFNIKMVLGNQANDLKLTET